MLQAALLFWLPVVGIGLGTWFKLGRRWDGVQGFGYALAVASGLVLLVSPWTVPSSPSTASVHLILSIGGPVMMTLVGWYWITFSGHVPVNRLNRSYFYYGWISLILGWVWFVCLHWTRLTPVYNGQVNPYWLVFFPTVMLVLSSFSFAGVLGLQLFGMQRQVSARLMYGVGIVAMSTTLLAMNFDGAYVSAVMFRHYLGLAAADLLGGLVGVSLSILVFVVVIWRFERNLEEPESLANPSEEQLMRASALIAKNLAEIANSVEGVNEDE